MSFIRGIKLSEDVPMVPVFPPFFHEIIFSSSQVVIEEFGRELNHFLASPSRDWTKSINNTSKCSTLSSLANA